MLRIFVPLRNFAQYLVRAEFSTNKVTVSKSDGFIVNHWNILDPLPAQVRYEMYIFGFSKDGDPVDISLTP